MKKWTLLFVCLVTALATGVPARAANDDGNRSSVTVSFGVGLNTAQPGNAVNHHILPRIIRVKKGGVVNFVVAGFHNIYVYQPGTRRDDLVVPPNPGPVFFNPLSVTNTNVIDTATFYYQGIVPAGGPPPGLPVTTNPSNAVNRVESVSFLEKGTYLVICNIRGHLLDGMYAYVKVGDDEDEDGN
jgi:plastocyanin